MENLQPKYHKRSTILAAILSLLAPGLGQLYNGQPKKAISIYSAFILIPVCLIYFRLITSYWGFIALLAFIPIIYIYSCIDAIIGASNSKLYILKKYNRALLYIFIVISALFLNNILFNNSFLGFDTKVITDVANEPQLKKGNKIFIDQKAYAHHPIQRGDLVAFKSPKDTNDIWVLRVIALPLDTLKINNFHPHVGYEIPRTKMIKDTTVEKYSLHMVEESWKNNRQYITLTQSDDSTYNHGNYPAAMVPDGHYYLMGDHRTQAFDSRFLGPIPAKNIIGKVKFIYGNLQKNQARDIK